MAEAPAVKRDKRREKSSATRQALIEATIRSIAAVIRLCNSSIWLMPLTFLRGWFCLFPVWPRYVRPITTGTNRLNAKLVLV